MNSGAQPEPVVVRKRPRIWLWVALTVLAFYTVLYAGSLTMLGVNASSAGNKFNTLALVHHQRFLLWTNLAVLKGYAVVALGYFFVLYPTVRLWMGEKRPPKRWGIVWRTALLTWLLMGFFVLRLIQTRPYFLGVDNYDHWWYHLLSGLPEDVRARVFFILFEFLPLIGCLSAAAFYVSHLLRRFRPEWPGGLRAGASWGSLLLLAGAWFAAPYLGGGPRVHARSHGPPNILILASDSLRGDHLSCNGYPRPTSPNIDALAAKSVNFQKMMTPTASTLESLTSIMTSQFPHTHGLQHMYPSKAQVEKMLSSSPNLADALERRGYQTSVLGDWCAGVFNVTKCGFDEILASDFDDFRLYISQTVFTAHFIMPLYFDNKLGYALFPQIRSFASFVTPEVVTERVIKKLDDHADADQPFFMTAFYSCTHLPYYCPPPYHERYADPEYDGKNKYKMVFDVDAFVKGSGIEEQWKNLPPKEVQQIVDLYDGCVNFFDDQVGHILQHMEKTGLMDNTIIVVMADHGDDLFDPNTTFSHGLTFNGGDQTNHIPFIVYTPGQRYAPRSVERLARTIDAAPTLLELAGLPREPKFEGVSLRPYLDGSSPDLSLAFFGETSYLFFKRSIPGEEPKHIPPLEDTTYVDGGFDFHFVLRPEYQQLVLDTKERCLRTEKWKLIYTPGEYHPIFRLYDLSTDPHCMRDVKLENNDVWQTMQERLRLWVEEKKESRIRDIFPTGEPEARGLGAL